MLAPEQFKVSSYERKNCVYEYVIHQLEFNFLFLCPATKSGGVLCYTLRTFECPSVRPSVRPPVRPSVRPTAVEHSCPVHNFDTVRDNFTKLGTNVKHDQTTCRDQQPSLHIHFLRNYSPL